MAEMSLANNRRLVVNTKMRFFLWIFCSFLAASSLFAGSVIFIHPDGASVAGWQAARMISKGPDGELAWDRLPEIAIYRGHLKDNLTSTSNGGATVHAYGVKVAAASFGTGDSADSPPVSAGGEPISLMMEAKKAGIRTGIINSGSIIEPGTACFVASSSKREDYENITQRVLESGVDIILSGGEQWMLPEGTAGRHGKPGKRKDGKDLIELARKNGYTVVFSKEELQAIAPDTKKLLGVFASEHTFNDQTEEFLAGAGLPLYSPTAPSVGDMTAKALELFGSQEFFLVVEEEGTDNFGNYNNASGTLEALLRADESFRESLAYLDKHPDTLLITAADSEAGGMDVIGLKAGSKEQLALAKNGRDSNGAPYDSAKDKPFESAPDQFGVRHPFVITWASKLDVSGGIVIRAAGRGSERIRGTMDNTDIYKTMRTVLFEK
jgi:alkaline phosphatase